MLANPETRDEIEIIGDQRLAIDELIQEIGRKNYEANAAFSKSSKDEKATKEFKDKTQENEAYFNKVVSDTLLPHQIQAISTKAFKEEIRGLAMSEMFSRTNLGEILSLTPEEQSRLAEKAKELEKGLAMQIEALRNDARNQLFDVLPAEKRRMLEKFGESTK